MLFPKEGTSELVVRLFDHLATSAGKGLYNMGGGFDGQIKHNVLAYDVPGWTKAREWMETEFQTQVRWWQWYENKCEPGPPPVTKGMLLVVKNDFEQPAKVYFFGASRPTLAEISGTYRGSYSSMGYIVENLRKGQIIQVELGENIFAVLK